MNLSKIKVHEWRERTEKDVQNRAKWINHFKYEVDSELTDQLAQDASTQAHRQINCLDCGNCCRTSVTDFNASDVKRAAKAIGISKKAFIKKYLMEDMDGKYVTITSPCPFLTLSDNTCQIYEVRPEVCRSYPHTHKEGFGQRKHAHSANLDMCPITYHTVEKMWSKWKFNNESGYDSSSLL